jgi:hypothetical protein
MIKGEEGESFEEFAARWKMNFDDYVPIPIIPDIEAVDVPYTCQQSTVDAREDLD